MPPLVWWGERDPGTRMTEPDRLILQALTAFEADLDDCGHPRSESMAWEHDPLNPDYVASYKVPAPSRCLACTALADAQRAYVKALGEDNAHMVEGTKWGVVLQERATRAAGG